MGSRGIKFHEVNGSNIDNTSFDLFEVIDGSTKVIKYHSEQHPIGKTGWIVVRVGIRATCLGGMHRLKNNVTDICQPVEHKRIQKKAFKRMEKLL